MPRTPKKRASSTSSSDDTKPYRKPQTPKSPKGQGQKSVPKKWTEEDKEKLLFSICESKGIDWEGICAKFPDRTASQVKDQWRQIVLPGLKKGRVFASAGK